MEFPFNFNDYSSTLLIFFFNGIIFSALTLRQGIIHNITASRWLSLLLFLYAMYITPYMLGYAGWYGGGFTREFLFFMPFMQVLLIGPVVYFYTKSLLNSSFKLTKKDYFHFIPAILYAVYSLVVFITDKLVLDAYYFYADNKDKDLSNWYQVTGLVSMFIYLIMSLKYYAYYKKILFETVSYAESILFKWIKNFMIAFLTILVLRIVFFITNPEWGNFGSQYWHYIAFSFVFYYIAITGYSSIIKQTALKGEKLEIINVFEENLKVEQNENKPNTSDKDDKKWQERLSELMTKKSLYENPRLTLSDVARELNTTTKIVSSTVNSRFNKNFNDYVNEYRIDAVKEKLNKGEHNTRTLLGIALDCGFNSKATFNRAFKKSTTLSPKDYLDKMA
ncbi:helix-turn-helix domain-containing protein [Winogradskyella sp.]